MKFILVALLTLCAFPLISAAQASDAEMVVGEMNLVERLVAPAQLTLNMQVELRDGVFSYREVAKRDLLIVEGEESTFTIYFKNEPYVATFKIRAEKPELQDSERWSLIVTRQDTVNGAPSGRSRVAHIALEKSRPVSVKFSGVYKTQVRDFRLTFLF
ncbi:hypothetical protein WDW37_09075 [Bdellovibrionota bacterium FG-1]